MVENRRGEPHKIQQLFDRQVLRPFDLKNLLKGLPHGHPRIERPDRVLEDHLEGGLGIESYPTRGGLLKADQSAGDRRLAGTGFADDPKDLPFPQVEAHALYGLVRAVSDVQVLNCQNRVAHRGSLI